jgi:hypothetical protein
MTKVTQKKNRNSLKTDVSQQSTTCKTFNKTIESLITLTEPHEPAVIILSASIPTFLGARGFD